MGDPDIRIRLDGSRSLQDTRTSSRSSRGTGAETGTEGIYLAKLGVIAGTKGIFSVSVTFRLANWSRQAEVSICPSSGHNT